MVVVVALRTTCVRARPHAKQKQEGNHCPYGGHGHNVAHDAMVSFKAEAGVLGEKPCDGGAWWR